MRDSDQAERALQTAWCDRRRPWLSATRAVILVATACTLAACSNRQEHLFARLDPERTGVGFLNRVEGDSAFNILTYPYFYDGGGVAAGDLNNDGLIDLFFGANQLPNALYLNRGDLRFSDITESAGVGGSGGWTKGVTMADVNADGLLDIYVSNVHFPTRPGRNELFVNNGDETFTERAAEYGLDFSGYASQASFFDYDRDGDLDVYLVNHSVHTEDTYGPDTLRYERHPLAGDRLLRNDDGRFVDASAGAGIYGGRIGYGLAAAVSDLDVDGCPDIFVSNDFHEHDYLYFNRCDGTFRESIRGSLGHTSRSSMGSDVADFDNDGLPDIFVADMLPAQQDILNSSANFEQFDTYQLKLRFGYHHQEIRNTLQWNRGNRRFSDVALAAGVFATDWSWASLFADFDNDGRQDLFVTNGIYRRPNDRDFTALVSHPPMMRRLGINIGPGDDELIQTMPSVPLANYVFRNEGDMRFSDVSSSWGLEQPGFSNGAVYADLDSDGDLDLVVNNVNDYTWIYENRSNETVGRHYLSVALRGDGKNTHGVGARVVVTAGGVKQVREMVASRGWQSSVPYRLHFGLGDVRRVDTLLVVWPDGRYDVSTGLPVDTLVRVLQSDARETFDYRGSNGPTLFIDRTDGLRLPYRHRENEFIDFNREGLMPRKVSQEGPALAVGDVNRDGLDDIFAGGAKWQAASLMLQDRAGSFIGIDADLWKADSLFEDVDAAFFDADSDGDLDLFVVSAGNEFSDSNAALEDRLYVNDGTGHFSRSTGRLPPMRTNGCCVAPADFDGDGDVDLFVGGRVTARDYGVAPRSFLLENDGAGFFRDVTEERAPSVTNAGMVSSAAWGDVDMDGKPDLVIAGDWMSIRVFLHTGDGFREATRAAGLDDATGLWGALLVTDVDGDDDPDIIAGNLGVNSILQAPPGKPLRMYVGDVDANGRKEHFLTTSRLGEEYVLASPDELLLQIPSLGRKYRRYHDFGRIELSDLFEGSLAGTLQTYEATTLSSVFAENLGDGTFTVRPLPFESQIAPVHAAIAFDIDGDSDREIVLAGNSDRARNVEGRYDASYGSLLTFSKTRGFSSVDPSRSGLYLEGRINHLRLLRTAHGRLMLVAARNNDRLQVLEISAASSGPGPTAVAP